MQVLDVYVNKQCLKSNVVSEYVKGIKKSKPIAQVGKKRPNLCNYGLVLKMFSDSAIYSELANIEVVWN